MSKMLLPCLLIAAIGLPAAARTGMDAVFFGGDKWLAHYGLDQQPAAPTRGIPGTYTSITADAAKISTVYGAHVDGGIYRAYYNGSKWVADQLIDNWGDSKIKYACVTRDAAVPEHIYAAAAEAGLDLIFYDGAQWVFRRLSAHAYKVVIPDSKTAEVVYGARADGGLDRIFYSDGHWSVEEINSNTYIALAPDSTTPGRIYAARTDGLDEIVIKEDVVQTNAINTSAYVALAGDLDGTGIVFGARKGGGVDRVVFDGKAWTATQVCGDAYRALTTDNGTKKAVYGARIAGGLDLISFDEKTNSWAMAYLQPYNYQTSWPYSSLTFDAKTPQCIYAAKAPEDNSKRQAADLFVDQQHPQASDENPGTEDRPLLTIKEAGNRVMPGHTIWVKDGVYRESAEVPAGEPGKLVAVRAVKGHKPVIKGSEIAEGEWVRLQGKQPIYWQSWEPKTQMVFVDGELLKQIGPIDNPAGPNGVPVDGKDVNDMYAGTFFYDAGEKKAYVWLLDGGNPAKHTIELGVRYIGLRFWDYAHIDGITVMHCQAGDAGLDNTALGGIGSGILIENVGAHHNDFAGLILNGSDCIIRNSEFSYNGNAGLTSSNGIRMRLEGCTWHHNNTRVYHPGWNDGTKILNWIDCEIIGNHSYDERSALWLDINNRNVLVAENLFENVQLGIYWEISRWAIVANNVFRNCSRGVWSYGSDCLTTNNVFINCRENVVYTTEIRCANYDHPHLCLNATRNNMAINNVVVKPRWPSHLDYLYRMVGEEEPHGGNNSYIYNIEVDDDPFVDSANGDFRLRDEFKGKGKQVPVELNSVYTSGAMPWAKTLVEDCEEGDCEPLYESWYGSKHYRAQPLPEPMDIIDVEKQPTGECGINFAWKESGNYPRF